MSASEFAALQMHSTPDLRELIEGKAKAGVGEASIDPSNEAEPHERKEQRTLKSILEVRLDRDLDSKEEAGGFESSRLVVESHEQSKTSTATNATKFILDLSSNIILYPDEVSLTKEAQLPSPGKPKDDPLITELPSKHMRSAHSFGPGQMTSKSWNRSRSSSFSSPVCRSSYASLPQSPAVSFLSQFAQSDDFVEPALIADGQILSGRYIVGRVIGRGNFAECREAFVLPGSPLKSSDSQKVAMKIIRHDEVDPHTLRLFEQELELWKQLEHPNLLPLLDTLYVTGSTVAIMPLSRKGNLLNYLAQHGPIAEDKARPIFKDLAKAVYYLHHDHQIVHRDIKLDNILLDGDLDICLADFGLSERIGPVEHKRHHEDIEDDCTDASDSSFCKGSLFYMPPELIDPSIIIRDASDLTLSEIHRLEDDHQAKSDIWSLGVVLYAMITGCLPFIDDYIPRLQHSILQGAYCKLPDDTSGHLQDLLDGLLKVRVTERLSIEKVLVHPWIHE